MINVRVNVVGDKRAFLKMKKIHTGYYTIVPRRTIKELAKRTQISMKLRVPRDTGDLAKSISVRPRGQNTMVIQTGTGLERPYDFYQSEGFRPHKVPVSKLNPKSMKFKGRKGGVVTVRRWGTRSKPYVSFIDDTMENYVIPNTPKIAKSILQGFLKETGG